MTEPTPLDEGDIVTVRAKIERGYNDMWQVQLLESCTIHGDHRLIRTLVPKTAVRRSIVALPTEEPHE